MQRARGASSANYRSLLLFAEFLQNLDGQYILMYEQKKIIRCDKKLNSVGWWFNTGGQEHVHHHNLDAENVN